MNRKIYAAAAALALAGLALGGCAGGDGGKDLGKTSGAVEFDDRAEVAKAAAEASCDGVDSEVIKAALEPSPKQITFTGGQDKAEVAFGLDIAEGTADYDASEVSATAPAEQRRKIVETITDAQRDAINQAFPDGIQGLIEKLSSAGVL